MTRGAIEDQELTKVAPAGVDIKRFEDNNATVSAFVSGQVQLIATGASVAGNMMAKNPQLGTEYKLLLKDSPNFIGVAKGEDKLRLKVNEIIAEAKKSGDIDKMANRSGWAVLRATCPIDRCACDASPGGAASGPASRFHGGPGPSPLLSSLWVSPLTFLLCWRSGRCCSRAWSGRWG